MNFHQTTIEWNQAQADSDAHFKRQKKFRQAMLEEFLDSNADMFSSQDFYYYAEETGKSMAWIIQNANFKSDIVNVLHNAFIDNDNELIDLIQIHFI